MDGSAEDVEELDPALPAATQIKWLKSKLKIAQKISIARWSARVCVHRRVHRRVQRTGGGVGTALADGTARVVLSSLVLLSVGCRDDWMCTSV